ncbi:hypothetical protein V8F06_006404 [Rhypophila decipiens]
MRCRVSYVYLLQTQCYFGFLFSNFSFLVILCAVRTKLLPPSCFEGDEYMTVTTLAKEGLEAWKLGCLITMAYGKYVEVVGDTAPGINLNPTLAPEQPPISVRTEIWVYFVLGFLGGFAFPFF